MQVAAFYIQGSNRIRVDVYGDGLDFSDSSSPCCRIVSSADGNVQGSAELYPEDFNDVVAHVIFNGMSYRHERYTVSAYGPAGDVLGTATPLLVDSIPSRNETNTLTDTLMRRTETVDVTIPETATVVVDTSIHSEMLKVDFSRPEPVLKGSASLSYSGGGNRYLTSLDGSLVLQKASAQSIDSDWSPLSLGTNWKAEDGADNLFTGFVTSPSGKESVQSGIYAYRFSSSENVHTDMWGRSVPSTELYFDLSPITFRAQVPYCLSFIGKCTKGTSARLYRVITVSDEEGERTVEIPVSSGMNENWLEQGTQIAEIDVADMDGVEYDVDGGDAEEAAGGPQEALNELAVLQAEESLSEGIEAAECPVDEEYDMVSFSFGFSEDVEDAVLRVKVECHVRDRNTVSVLMPQVEEGEYPTSRIVSGCSRAKDRTVLSSEGCDVGKYGYVACNMTYGRKRTASEGCCIVEWVTEEGNGIRIMQDGDDSVVACLYSDGSELPDTVRSAPVGDIEEGESLSVRFSWDLVTKSLKLTVNEAEYASDSVSAESVDCSGDIRIGWSENLGSFDGDIETVTIGK